MKRVLVTGSSGFIGKALCEDLLDKGIKVWGISRSDESPINHPNYKHFKHDIRKEIVTFFPVDTIFHLASPATNKAFWDKPTEVAETILLGTINITKYAVNLGVNLFYASSYGAANIDPKYRFRDCYDVSKRAGETYVGDYPTSKLKSYTMRIPSVYGRGMPVFEDKIIPNFIRDLLNRKEVVMYGQAHEKRTYVHIDDLLRQIHYQIENRISMVDAVGADLTAHDLKEYIKCSLRGEVSLNGLEETIEYFKSTLASTCEERDQ